MTTDEFFFFFNELLLKLPVKTNFYYTRVYKDRVREEIFSIFGNSDRDATIEDMTAMRYLEAVIKESLRIYPSVPANTRKLDTTLKLSEYLLKKD